MRSNLPITQRELELREGMTLMSTTDTQSHLIYANAAFVEVSGFERDELMGQPHNIVRHPDMPPEAFADMWQTLKAGKSWTALVKNRRKDGDHYWVRANATPVKRGGVTVGYMSVRTKPSREEVAAASDLYAAFRSGKAQGLAFHQGLVIRTGVFKWMSVFQLLPTAWRIRLGVMGLVLACAMASVLLPNALPVLLAAIGAGGLLASWWIERQVSAPLKSILANAELIAAGQSVAVPALNRVDDIGLLARAINQSGLNLRSLLDDVAQQVQGIQVASTEIANGNSDLSARTEQSAASLEQTAASMAEMNATVANNSERTQEAERLAAQASTDASHGRQEFSNVAETMASIQASSKRIADITSLIDGIAFQTNILALNAAVEAARAGEQGRGFAVVAAEVRSLAQRSAAAAKDIKGLIDDSGEKVQKGSALIGRAGETMAQIVGGVQRVSGLIEEISSATREQAMGISQVDTAITQLDQTTQQNAALVEQSAAAASSLRQQAIQLAEAVRAFRS
ncbi:MAG: methyl-accepting chemotaxis protein [Hydrogenophaga sp.]|uniref:methyl-accepting chemotaxis protein n=1 Tax=Hydrogenophaga sp. TaxID=1904254 RepID=UPI002ABB119A|nr:methyl-accepting chemotaxis protein [Hydrogenophaga sp.]MDZ4127606.1 methyl-accepting chemotaxis protein [Hydrogenophaga sp.]MDZ4280465.1 methyl-accepting chemotaxis protein [Hydrogenophaga sp.]